MCLNLAEATQGFVLALSLGLRDLWSSGPVTRTKSNGFVWRRVPAEVLLMDTEDAAKSQAGKKIKGKDYFSYHWLYNTDFGLTSSTSQSKEAYISQNFVILETGL